MSIQERINPDNLNIHQFQETPEGRLDLPFDPDRDITPDQKEKIKEEIATCLNNISGSDPDEETRYIATARHYKVLWPHELHPGSNLSPKILENVKLALISDLDLSTRPNYFLACLKIANPELDMEGASFPIKMELDESRRDKTFYSLSNAAGLKILKPDFNISEKDIRTAKNIVEKMRESGHLLEAMIFASDLRLLDPSYKPELTEQEWDQFNEHLRSKAATDWDEFADTAELMKILAAHSVKITAPGVIDIQIYPPADVSDSTPSIPETRKF